MKPPAILHAAAFTAFLFVPFLTTAEHFRGLYGTGMRDDWSPQGAIYGDWERHYTLADPDGNYIGPNILRVNTGPHSGGYSWPIGAYSGQLTAPVGVWTFRTTFVMENLNTNKATLRGLWRTIRHGAMLLNGQPVAHYTSDGWFARGVQPNQFGENRVKRLVPARKKCAAFAKAKAAQSAGVCLLKLPMQSSASAGGAEPDRREWPALRSLARESPWGRNC